MGNASSNVTSGVKKQADTSSQKLYQLVDLKGGGLLVELTKQATTTKNYAALDEAIKAQLEPFLYNNGHGIHLHVSKLVLMRNKERGKTKHIFKNEADFDIYNPEDHPEDKLTRHVCWRIDQRGAVGETCLHLCLLNATSVHAELAKRLLKFYPKLINDIYIGEEYYGENVLHMAIVNEDPSMVKYLLDNGVNPLERCFGCFMSPEDQKDSRMDSLEHEWVQCDKLTNYLGYVYWGEYPASFAACLGQEECYRMILAKGADPDAQDTNGNTVLHMLVIHAKMHMFNMAYELGASLNVKNNLNLTPLTLAAKSAKKHLFFHILNIEREIYWQIGNITCAAYPLPQFDTIDTATGGILKESALNLIVFGETRNHLELLEGPVVDLLTAKWKTFVRYKFYSQFFLFVTYFLLTSTYFIRRPVHKHLNPDGKNNSIFLEFSSAAPLMFSNISLTILNSPNGSTPGVDIERTCGDKNYQFPGIGTGLMEIGIMSGALAFLIGACREWNFLGSSMFFENLATVPSRVIFLFSCFMVQLMGLFRIFCLDEFEDIVGVIVMLTTAPYFLFFSRGFKTVGPFVVMIYRMITGDLLRFVIIYLVFVMGFSQAFYIIFLSFSKPDTENPLKNPVEATITMFMMSLSSFEAFELFQYTDHEYVAKFLFVIFMAIVAILLINMLIAMMGNTYTKIAETKNEWQRQWARIVLVVERGVNPRERHLKQGLYSQKMEDSTRALVLRLNQTEEEREDMLELLEIRRYHNKAIQRRQNLHSKSRIVQRKSISNSLLSMKLN